MMTSKFSPYLMHLKNAVLENVTKLTQLKMFGILQTEECSFSSIEKYSSDKG